MLPQNACRIVRNTTHRKQELLPARSIQPSRERTRRTAIQAGANIDTAGNNAALVRGRPVAESQSRKGAWKLQSAPYTEDVTRAQVSPSKGKSVPVCLISPYPKHAFNFPLAKLTNAGRIEDTTMSFTDIQLPTVDKLQDRVLHPEKYPVAPVDIYEDVRDWWNKQPKRDHGPWCGPLNCSTWDEIWPEAREQLLEVYNSIKNH